MLEGCLMGAVGLSQVIFKNSNFEKHMHIQAFSKGEILYKRIFSQNCVSNHPWMGRDGAFDGHLDFGIFAHQNHRHMRVF